jgi:hypothetical protein
MAAAEGLEMQGMGDQKKEKAEDDGELQAMPLEDGQDNEGKGTEQKGSLRQKLFVDLRRAPALELIEILSPAGPHG